MGTIVVDSILTASNTIVVTDLVKGSVSHTWLTYSTTGSTKLNSSYNISSIADVATGIIIISFSNSFKNTNYGATSTATGRTVPTNTSGEGTGSHGVLRRRTGTVHSVTGDNNSDYRFPTTNTSIAIGGALV